MAPDVQTRHHLPLDLLQPWLKKTLAQTEFPDPEFEPSGSEKAKLQRGWADLRSVKQFSFGQSNPTYLLVDQNDNHAVLRSRPSGKLISPTAHNLQREFTVLTQLNLYNEFLVKRSSELSTNNDKQVEDWLVPVPRVYAYYQGDEKAVKEGAKKLGMPEFYLMEYKKGEVFEDCEFPEFGNDQERAECWRLAIRTLSILSTVPLSVLNLPKNFGPPPHVPVPFYERQVRGLLRVSQAQGNTKMPPNSDRETIGPIEGEEQMVPYLVKGAKERGKEEVKNGVWALVHGDYKMDNLIFRKSKRDGKWRVIGVLDWELCTVGSPLSDLGNLMVPYSIDPYKVPVISRPDSISYDTFESHKPAAERASTERKKFGASNLLKGLLNLPEDALHVPTATNVEKYWVECMKEGESWGEQVKSVFKKEKGESALGDTKHEVGPEQKVARWKYPVQGLNWVRSWMLWRLAIISQGVTARAALGQASSALAVTDKEAFDVFGRLASDCMRRDLAEGHSERGDGRESKL